MYLIMCEYCATKFDIGHSSHLKRIFNFWSNTVYAKQNSLYKKALEKLGDQSNIIPLGDH